MLAFGFALTVFVLSSTPRLAYEVHQGSGPHLVLLHGFLSSSAQWMLNLEALGEVCTPVSVELWGHGRSPAPVERSWYRPQAYIDQLEMLRADLGAEEWFLCGYSLGAGITVRYTCTYPDRVIGHILTNSSSAFADEELAGSWRQDAEEGAERIIEGGNKAIERIAVHPRHARRLPEPVYNALLADAAELAPVGVANAFRDTSPNASVRDIAADNPRPALLCFGQHEKRFYPGKEWAETHMANLEIAPLNAGHAVNMEDADGFNAVVTEFIRRLS